MASAFDDEELSMSLSKPQTRPGQQTQRKERPQEVLSPRSFGRDLPKGSKTEQRIGQYTIIRTLGEGSFGKVKLAMHRISGQEVALKIISRKRLISRDMAGRVEREIQYLQLLRHPHIIKLYTVITTPNEIIMVLEYAGGELFDYIVKHGKMNENKARRFFQQIVCAVEYCHRHKIVHRDLKPENLLLDKDLNVKIADFGLSNIMTDGNFLKTSCGSPNYAAPEVISGKLYAGPEVDVWSCGIILYVLLVGRLPFDDEYIPTLFKMITAGQYYMPPYLSSGSKHLIRRMLQTNPVSRITIQEIRQDPWFNENLEDYLKPPVEEFIDTGVDPNKAIDPRKLAPGKPLAVQEEIHKSVIGKLEKTIGYNAADVQDALSKDEPNAIKDAYMIVRENQIMRNNPALTTVSNTQPFAAASPPAWDTPNTPLHRSSPITQVKEQTIQQPPSGSPIAKLDNQNTPSPKEALPTQDTAPASTDNHVSKIGILASSMPFYHQQYMEQHRERLQNGGAVSKDTAIPKVIPQIDNLSLDGNPRVQSPEEQAETLRRLKPASLSTLQLQNPATQPLAQAKSEDDPKPDQKKHKTRWQFGIRSRNMPYEAMHCVYKALIAQGAEWEVPGTPEEDDTGHSSYPVYVSGATRLNETIDPSRAPSPEIGRHAQRSRNQDTRSDHERSGTRGHRDADSDVFYETEDEDVDVDQLPQEYIPKDPWCIRVRWRRDGMLPIALPYPMSTNSSRLSLTGDEGVRQSNTIDSQLSARGSVSNISATGSAASKMSYEVSSGACYVYMDVQLYMIESHGDRGKGTYLVDFKCSGYEPLIERAIDETHKELVGLGYRLSEKDATSPQPFLDMTNKLVIFLASERS